MSKVKEATSHVATGENSKKNIVVFVMRYLQNTRCQINILYISYVLFLLFFYFFGNCARLISTRRTEVVAGHQVLQLLGVKLESKPNRTPKPYPNDGQTTETLLVVSYVVL